MEDLAVFTALKHLGSFRKNCIKFQKNKYVICLYGENCDLGLENAALSLWPWAVFSRLLHSFSPYRPPSLQITYIYVPERQQINVTYSSKVLLCTMKFQTH